MKTIFVPTSRSSKATNALTVARYLAAKSQATVELFPLEKGHFASQSVDEGFTGNQQFNQSILPEYIHNSVQTQQGGAQQTDTTELAIPEADLIVMDAALVRGRYKTSAATEAEGTKGSYASEEFIMDDHAEGTKGACAAHELPLHPAVQALMKQAHCPVLTVIPYLYETVPLKTVVLVTDGEQGTAPLFDVLSQLQRIFRFKLYLLHINRCFHHQPEIEVVNNMRELAKNHSLTHYQIQVIEDYTYEEGIIHFSEMVHPDMIALPVDGHKIISHLLEEIFSHSDASLAVQYLLTYKVS